MTDELTIEHCPGCGAPLEMDGAGNCRWCGEHIVREAEQPAAGESFVIPPMDYLTKGGGTLPLPAYSILSCLWYIAMDPAIRAFLAPADRIGPGRDLTGAVQRAGERIQDAGTEDKVALDGQKLYTPEEWWVFDLAVDFIVMLGAVGGVNREHLAAARDAVRLHDKLWGKRVRKPIAKAGDGPEQLRSLRAQIAHRPQ